MQKYRKDVDAISRLSLEQYRVTQQGATEYPGSGGISTTSARHLRGRRVGRAAVRFVRQVRPRDRLAELHAAVI
jgi:hypothetical protein